MSNIKKHIAELKIAGYLPSRHWMVIMLMFLNISFIAYAASVDHKVEFYESQIRNNFKSGQWNQGKITLDLVYPEFGDFSAINELMGQYYVQMREYDKARFYLIKSDRLMPNARAKELLVKIEEITGHYSDALCYVNELLEFRPYSKNLWLKKIAILRLQGNTLEADRQLKRLYTIFPNDADIKRRYMGNIEENFNRVRHNNVDDAIEMARNMVKNFPHKAQYWEELVTLLNRKGLVGEAMATADQGIETLRGNTSLARRHIGMLEDQHRYQEALDYAKHYNDKYGGLGNMLIPLKEEVARGALANDPYVQYAKLYDETKSPEAYNFLLNTAIARGYNYDALHYIEIALRKNPRNTKMLTNQYKVYLNMGDRRRAFASLTRAYESNPYDMDIAEELGVYHNEDADRLMAAGMYEDAIPHLDFVIDNSREQESLLTAKRKKVDCLTQLHRYDDALQLLETARYADIDDMKWYVTRANLLSKMGRPKEALEMLYRCVQYEQQMSADDDDDINVRLGQYVYEYEELAVPIIKEYMAAGAVRNAYESSMQLLTVNPSSQIGLLYAINTSALLHKNDEMQNLLIKARDFYPDDVTFTIKQAGIYNQEGEHELARSILREHLDSLSGDTLLRNTFAASTELLALRLIDEKQPDKAIEVLNEALLYSPDNRSLLYDKGLAFEKLHRYDSAHFYQKFYQPSIMEVNEFRHHLNGLLHRGATNELEINYQQSRYGDSDILRGIASVAYRHRTGRNTFGMTVNYSGRDGNADNATENAYSVGGTGVQLLGEWTLDLGHSWTTQISGGWATRYFPQWTGQAKISHTFGNSWTVQVQGGYRRVEASKPVFVLSKGTDGFEWVFDHWFITKGKLYSVGGGIQKDFPQVMVGVKGDMLSMQGKAYFNASVSSKFYPLDERITNLNLTAGVGTAPETAVLDFGLPGSFSHINTNVALGFTYLLTPTISGGLTGSWFTYYNQVNTRSGNDVEYNDKTTTHYKNLFNLNITLNINF